MCWNLSGLAIAGWPPRNCESSCHCLNVNTKECSSQCWTHWHEWSGLSLVAVLIDWRWQCARSGNKHHWQIGRGIVSNFPHLHYKCLCTDRLWCPQATHPFTCLKQKKSIFNIIHCNTVLCTVWTLTLCLKWHNENIVHIKMIECPNSASELHGKYFF